MIYQMESDQYFGDLDEEIRYSMKARPRRWLGLFAGLVVGVVLGILSSNTFVEFTFWILLGCSTACVSWVIVLLASLIGGSLCNKLGLRARTLPRIFRFLGILIASVGFTCLLGVIFKSRGFGIGLTLAPTIFFICVYWTMPRGQSFGLMSILLVGALSFISSFKLFTVPALEKPPTVLEKDDSVHDRKDIIRVLTLNLRGSGILQREGIKDPKRLAQVVGPLDVDVVLLQGLESKELLSELVSELGKDWSANEVPDENNSTAIISKFNGQLESLAEPNYGITIFGILRNNKVIRFVSCEPVADNSSRNRREMVDWLLSECRKSGESVVVAGNFYFNPNDRWNLISPMLTDSISIDRASWRALGLLGDVISYKHSDPLGAFSWKLHKNREWIIVDPSIEIVETSLPDISLGEGNALVFSLKPTVQKKSKPEDSSGVSF
jgi:hypothetical protein|tara:strand:+ start:1438 stop:2751 length:1314 start_codon:yes stop_codon:yes gene_type:complete